MSRVVDMREHVSAAACLTNRRPAIAGGLEHLRYLGERDAALGSLETRRDTLTGNRARDEHDPPVVTCEHSAACGSLLDIEREDETSTTRTADQSKATTGKRYRSRIKRATAARCDSSNALSDRRSLKGASSSPASTPSCASVAASH